MLAIFTLAMLIIMLMDEKSAAKETGATMSNGQRTWVEMQKHGKKYWVLKNENQLFINNK